MSEIDVNNTDYDPWEPVIEGDCPDCEGTGEVCCNCDDHGCPECIDGVRSCRGCDGSGFMPIDQDSEDS